MTGMQDRVALGGTSGSTAATARDLARGASPMRDVAEDAVLLREGLVRVLRDGGFEVVGAVGDAAALELVERERVDVAIVDIRMPRSPTPMKGSSLPRTVAREPSVPVVVLSQNVEPATRSGCSATGGVGSVTSLGARRGGGRPARRGRQGRPRGYRGGSGGRGSARGPASSSKPARRSHAARARGPRAHGRGPIQRAIVTPIVGDKTVETHVASILSKLGLEEAPDDHRRVLAVLSWLRLRLVARDRVMPSGRFGRTVGRDGGALHREGWRPQPPAGRGR